MANPCNATRPVLGLLCAVVAATAVGAQAGRDLLRSSASGAYSVRYLPDRALVSSSSQAQAQLAVFVPQRPLWAYLDEAALQPAAFDWDAESELVTLAVAEGSHRIEIGWAGDGARPPQRVTIPVCSDGALVGTLSARFTLDAMVAEGAVEMPRGVARAWLAPVGEAAPGRVTLSVGPTVLDEWRPAEGRMRASEHVAVGGTVPLRLSVEAYNLLACPFSQVELEPLSVSAPAVRVEAMPEDGIIVEAESFVREGGNTVLVSEGAHVDQHAGKSIYSFQGDGHWLEWEFETAEAGDYDLFARVSCGEEMSFRGVTIDGDHPARGFRLVQFPGTGGWAHAPGEWWAVQVAGGSDQLPPLRLSAGRHTLRLEGVFSYHLNIDYFVLRKR